jgi:hypothetical protein
VPAGRSTQKPVQRGRNCFARNLVSNQNKIKNEINHRPRRPKLSLTFAKKY